MKWISNQLENIKKEGSSIGEKHFWKKKGPFQIFVGSPELWIHLAGQLVYSGSIANLNFEWNRPAQSCWARPTSRTQALGSVQSMTQAVGSWLQKGLKMLGRGGRKVHLGIGSWWVGGRAHCYWILVVETWCVGGRAQRCWVLLHKGLNLTGSCFKKKIQISWVSLRS